MKLKITLDLSEEEKGWLDPQFLVLYWLFILMGGLLGHLFWQACDSLGVNIGMIFAFAGAILTAKYSTPRNIKKFQESFLLNPPEKEE